MTNPWSQLAANVGPKAVMSQEISDETFAVETARQIPILMEAIRPLLNEQDQFSLDYGCGHGRFTAALADCTGKPTWGYDPCQDMLPEGQNFVSTVSGQFSPILCFAVLGDPHMDTSATADHIASLLAPGGLFVLVDHMSHSPKPERWWQFRSMPFYTTLFASRSIELQKIGEIMQLTDTLSILAGRQTR